MSFFGGSFPKRMLCGEPKESRFPLAPYVHPAVQQKESKSTGAIWMCGSWTGAAGFWRLEPRQNWTSPFPSRGRGASAQRLAVWLAGSLAAVGRRRCSLPLQRTAPSPFLSSSASSRLGQYLASHFPLSPSAVFIHFLLAMGFFGGTSQS